MQVHKMNVRVAILQRGNPGHVAVFALQRRAGEKDGGAEVVAFCEVRLDGRAPGGDEPVPAVLVGDGEAGGLFWRLVGEWSCGAVGDGLVLSFSLPSRGVGGAWESVTSSASI